jgi:hypothetical protein
MHMIAYDLEVTIAAAVNYERFVRAARRRPQVFW